MTEMKVNSFFPMARSESGSNGSGSGSESDFAFSLRSANGTDSGKQSDLINRDLAQSSGSSPSSARRTEAVQTRETEKTQVRFSDKVKAETDSKAKAVSTDNAGTYSGNGQEVSVKAQNSAEAETDKTLAVSETKAGQTVGNADKEFSELQNQKSLNADIPKKQPMLDLNRILERVGEFIGKSEGNENSANGEVVSNLVGADMVTGLGKTYLADNNASEATETEAVISIGNVKKADLDRTNVPNDKAAELVEANALRDKISDLIGKNVSDDKADEFAATKAPRVNLSKLAEVFAPISKSKLIGIETVDYNGDQLAEKEVLNNVQPSILEGGKPNAEINDSEKVSAITETDLSGKTFLGSTSNSAPTIDLNHILGNLVNSENNTEAKAAAIPNVDAEENREITAEPIAKPQTNNALPQINFNRIMESVKGFRQKTDAASLTDFTNPLENIGYAAITDKAEKAAEGIVTDTAYSEKIASNVASLWNNLTAVITAAQDYSETEEIVLDLDRPIEAAAETGVPQDSMDSMSSYHNEAFGSFKETFAKFTRNVRSEDTPSTLDQLKAKLAEAMAMAIAEMSDPGKQAEELEEKILEFLLKFLEKMNKDENGDKEETNASDGQKKGGDLGLLIQMIENLIDEVRADYPTDSDEDTVYEAAPVKVAEAAKAESGAEANYAQNADTVKAEKTSAREASAAQNTTAVSQTAYAVSVPMEYSESDTGRAYKIDKLLTVEGKPVRAENGNTAYIAKVGENPEDINAKADKVLNKPNRDGKIRTPSFSDEFEELKRLFGDTEKKEKEELPVEEDDDEENGNKGKIASDKRNVTLDEKSKIVSSMTLNSAEADKTAVAKSFEGKADAKQILTQIASEVLNNAPKEKKTVALVMTLNPESLGKVTLKITEQAGKLSVIVTAHNKETAEILASRMEGLQDALKDSGTQLEKYQVVYGPEQQAGGHQQSYEGSSKNPYVRNDIEEGTDKDGEFSELLKEAV